MADTQSEHSSGNWAKKERSGSAQSQLPKRFYRKVEVGETDDGFTVLLDGKPVRTPAKRKLILPDKAIARSVAEEFDAQATVIDPGKMPATRLANTTIDGIADDSQAVIEDILRFASVDLLCYRAGQPQGLVDRQNAAWDPIVDWARNALGADMVLAEGVMHVDQKPAAIAAIGARLRNHSNPFAIAGLHVMTTLTGSALLALAVAEQELSAEQAWQAAHVDEDWNIAQWGEDAEAGAKRAARHVEMLVASGFVDI